MTTITKQLYIKGMHCASCAQVIGRTLRKTAGVEACEVNYGTETAQIVYDPKEVKLEDLSKKIEPLGYGLIMPKMDHQEHTMPDGTVMSGMDHAGHLGLQQSKQEKLKELKAYKQKLDFVLPVAALVFFIMMWEILGSKLGLPALPLPPELYAKILLVLSTPVLFWAGRPFLKGFYNFLRHGAANMDTLIGMGTLVAFIYSAFVVLFPSAKTALKLPDLMFFDVTIVVIGFILLGKFLEIKSKIKTGEAIEKLLELGAKTALVIRQGREVEIPVNEVAVGDRVAIRPGMKIPVDGIILEGSSHVDESMVTGEAMPAKKQPGDEVVGGTINKEGAFVFEAKKVGSETLLSHIIKMVQAAQGSKAPIEKLADKVSAIFVPVVLGIAIISLILWLVVAPRFMPFSQALSYGILCFVGVLVIACPCALGLATPTAIIVGVGKGAQSGILIKNAESLEKLRLVDTLVVDKTGTLTVGHPEVIEIQVLSIEYNVLSILQIASSLESKSEHPLAEAVINKAKEEKAEILPVENFEALPGKGVKGVINGRQYFAGSPKFAQEMNLKIDEQKISVLTGQGKTPVALFDNETVLAIFVIADQIKENAKPTIGQLHHLGVKIIMMSGDDPKTAEFIAKELGIGKVFGRMLPQDKAVKIKELQAQGRVIAMAGDGINDAPALAQSNVGIAMGSGTDVAIETADVTLLHGDISKILQAIKLSRAALRTVKQNLFWAFIYNIVGIPLAAGLFYPIFGWLLNPAFAGLAMALSSVSVVFNSLRLKRLKI